MRTLEQVRMILIKAGFNSYFVNSMKPSELRRADDIQDWDILVDYMNHLRKN